MRRTMLLSGTAALAVLCYTATASAGGPAETTVTIKTPGSEIYGYVKSPKPNRCANGRKVVVFKKRPGDDERIQSDTAQPNGDRYMWSIGNPGVSGTVYAKAPKIDGCEADKSPESQA